MPLQKGGTGYKMREGGGAGAPSPPRGEKHPPQKKTRNAGKTSDRLQKVPKIVFFRRFFIKLTKEYHKNKNFLTQSAGEEILLPQGETPRPPWLFGLSPPLHLHKTNAHLIKTLGDLFEKPKFQEREVIFIGGCGMWRRFSTALFCRQMKYLSAPHWFEAPEN